MPTTVQEVPPLDWLAAFTVRDNRQPRHFWADNELVDDYLPKIGMTAFAVYMLLCRLVNNTTGQCDPSIAYLARKLNLSKPTIRKAIDTLVTHQLITVEHRAEGALNDTNLYTLRAIKPPQTEPPQKPTPTPKSKGGGKRALPGGGKASLPGVVNTVDSNNTDNQDLEDSLSADADDDPKQRDPRVCLSRLIHREAWGVQQNPGTKFTGVLANQLIMWALGEKPAPAAIFKFVSEVERMYTWRKATTTFNAPRYLEAIQADIEAYRASLPQTPTGPQPKPDCPRCHGEGSVLHGRHKDGEIRPVRPDEHPGDFDEVFYVRCGCATRVAA